MTIRVECPGCEHALNVPDSYAGKKGKCPKCGTIFRAAAADEIAEFPLESLEDEESDDPPAPSPAKTSKASTPKIPAPKRKVPGVPKPAKLRDETRPPKPAAPADDSPADLEEVDALDAAAAEESGGGSPLGLSSGGSDPLGARRRTAAKKANLLPVFIVIGVAGFLAAGTLAAIVVSRQFGRDGATDVAQDDGEADGSDPSAADGGGNDGAITPNRRTGELTKNWDGLKSAVVTLTVHNASGSETGIGVIVDPRGWLATASRLIEGAQRAEAKFASGSMYSIEGIIGIDKPHGLTLLKLGNMPTGIKTLSVAGGAKLTDGAEIYIRDHSDELKHCDVEKMIAPGEMAASLSFFLREQGLSETKDLCWIRHNAAIAAEDRGAPLLNEAGEVVGVAVQLNENATLGYAIDARHLADLVAGADEQVTPFGEDQLAEADPDDALPDDAEPDGDSTVPDDDEPSEPDDDSSELPAMPDDDEPDDNEPDDALPDDTVPDDDGPALPQPAAELSVESLTEAAEECRRMEWTPATGADYAKLQRLAELVDKATSPGADADAAGAAEQLLDEMSADAWKGDRVRATNDLAKQAFETEGRPTFFYGRAIAKSMLNGDTPAVAMRLSGTQQWVVVPAKENADQLTPNQRFLVIGRHDGRLQIQGMEGGDKPAVRIAANHVISEPQ